MLRQIGTRWTSLSRRGVAQRRLLTSQGKVEPGKKLSGTPNPVPTATRLFYLSNPELMVDPKKASSWKLVVAVWVVFGGIMGYMVYTEKVESDALDKAYIGPRRRDGAY